MLQLELGEARGQLRAAKAASAAAYERVEALAAQLASVQGVSPLGLILRPSRVSTVTYDQLGTVCNTADQAFPWRSLRCTPVLQGHLRVQEQRWSMTGSELPARSHGSHGRRHRSSPGELAPSQRAISADLGRPASLSLVDIGMTGLAQLGSGRARKADSARQPRQARRQSEAGQHTRLWQGSESPVKRRRWTLAGVSI